jgi:hypothetical protein
LNDQSHCNIGVNSIVAKAGCHGRQVGTVHIAIAIFVHIARLSLYSLALMPVDSD